mgnify:CR=1 FL=1
MPQLLDNLNPEQLAAVTLAPQHALILAGAGSGKTRVITQKIAYLVQDCGFQPRNIAAITFTNKAAAEMRERAKALIGAKAAGKLRIEGKDYVMADGDVVHFRFNV